MLKRIEIEKALFNKKIESFVYNPNLVVNRNTKNIKDRIIRLLEEADRVDIAVSYSVWSGLQLIYEKLKKFSSDSRFILTIEGFVTDPISLRKLNELDMQVKVYSPTDKGKGFHLKTYFFEKNDERKILVGSANISSRAFGLVHEMAIEVEANKDGYIVEEYKTTFEDLWNDNFSDILDDTYVKGYEEIYKDYKKSQQFIYNLSLQSQLIKPNHMQKEALDRLDEERESKKGLVIAATGTGKTYLSAFDVKRFNAKKVLFLVHNRLILTSAIDTYNRLFGDDKTLELTSDNISEINHYPIIFTTDKTAKAHLYNKISEDYFDYIIYDEAHKIGESTQYSKLIEYFKPKYTLGITATPERTKNPEYLFETFEYHVPYEIRLLDAMNYELVCPFTYFGLNIPERLLDSNERFHIDELTIYMKNLINTKGHYGEKLKAIVFCRDKKEAIDVNDGLNKLGFKSIVAISGANELSRDDVEEGIVSLSSNEKGTIELICVVNKFNEGIDIPEINTIFMLRNTSSSIIYTQQLGRGLRRTFDEHKFVTVFDLIGNSKNDYSIAQVLTGNQTADKRELYKHANNGFVTVSPFINVDIEKEAMDKIIKSISNNFKVKTELRIKFETELHRYEYIPTLKEMYMDPNFSDLELLQLLYKDFYTPFSNYYNKKYGIDQNNFFLKNFFRLITQFVLRGYSKEILKDYINILKGNQVNNDLLKRILLFNEIDNGIATSIYSSYYKKGNNYIKVFQKHGLFISLNKDVKNKLVEFHALKLFEEHIELFEEIQKQDSYHMSPFDLIDKAEYLFHTNSNNCYLNAVGEYVDNDQKKVYCPITISKVRKNYSNQILDNNTLIYCTQKKPTLEKSVRKDNELTNGNYKFHICARFPHLGYESTSYFNLGEIEFLSKSNTIKHPDGGYYHELTFRIKDPIPRELLQYKEIDY
ncbi:MAG: DEAD/DEAH box helicase family protein [Acholeplasma sp.]|uniref:DEAD/DEAH box helicase family protein n=1 Tax=Hujiaoplasma nucleasis TaxID=2725268 RepID=A0A7L6N6Y5_9MOLU|nr:DEAD/DEAH box helicase family protein [Hujiaoplasma nucleasis]MDY0278198.1 DEAD/DEAH box helicase family protein [Acholeplasma sp.]QLY40294.1 DEAD/DEAH box helicase family protein [Hujiaoplasma nucleasis]